MDYPKFETGALVSYFGPTFPDAHGKCCTVKSVEPDRKKPGQWIYSLRVERRLLRIRAHERNLQYWLDYPVITTGRDTALVQDKLNRQRNELLKAMTETTFGQARAKTADAIAAARPEQEPIRGKPLSYFPGDQVIEPSPVAVNTRIEYTGKKFPDLKGAQGVVRRLYTNTAGKLMADVLLDVPSRNWRDGVAGFYVTSIAPVKAKVVKPPAGLWKNGKKVHVLDIGANIDPAPTVHHDGYIVAHALSKLS